MAFLVSPSALGFPRAVCLPLDSGFQLVTFIPVAATEIKNKQYLFTHLEVLMYFAPLII